MIFDELYVIIHEKKISCDKDWEIVLHELTKEQLIAIAEKSDQEIRVYLKEKNLDENSIEFKIFQNIKINQSIDALQQENEAEQQSVCKNAIIELF